MATKSPKTPKGPLLAEASIESLEPDKLEFDRANPRLAGYGITPDTKDGEIISILWEEMAVDEVAMSIAASGYWPHEPLIVVEEKGKWVVIEGNRRLAAIKALLDPKIASKVGCNVTPSSTARKTLERLPIIKTTREDSWRYLGFRHVNGPARWGSYAKAEYIRKVHIEYKIPLPDIAEQIGDRHKTVQRLYRSLTVLKQAEQAKVYSLEDRQKKNLPFSHLYTALEYDGFRSYLGLSDEPEDAAAPVPKRKLADLGRVLVWLFGSKREKAQPLVVSQNPDLRNLDKALRSEDARRALMRGSSLADAVVLADPAKDRLRIALLDSKSLLQTATGLAPLGYDGEEDLLRISGTVAQLADKLYELLETRHVASKTRNSGPKSRLTDA